MSDNITLPGTGEVVASDQAVDGTLGTVQFQYVKIADGDIGSTTKYGTTNGFPIQGKQASLQSGTITTATSTVTATGASGYNLATVGIIGTYAGVSGVFEASPDGTNWFALQAQRTDTGLAESSFTALTNTTRAWDVPIGAWAQFRVRATAWTSGTATVLLMLQTFATEPIPTAVQGPNSGSGIYWYMSTAPISVSTLSNVASSATNVTLLAANSSARARMVFNDSTAILYLKHGVTASATSHTVQIPAGGYYEFPQPLYQGQVDGLWAAANGSARMTEQT